MSTTSGQVQNGDSRKLQASADGATTTDEGLELSVKLRNPLDRPVRYVSDVRGMVFDPATRRLAVRLSDRGRKLPPGSIAIEPRFRMIDPNSEAAATVRVPKTIVKLSETPSPAGDTLFE